MNFKTRLGFDIAKMRGRKAAREGKLPKDNPYRYSELGGRPFWDAGWWEVENEMAVEGNRAVRTIDGSITLIGANIERQKQFVAPEVSR